MKLTTSGEDPVKFTVEVPGHCGNCKADAEVVVTFNVVSLKRWLENIDPAYTVVAERGKKPHSLGVTCGCYATFHRQVAHIRDRRKKR